jgi:WhiB family redox-sensing transcriptional regulator
MLVGATDIYCKGNSMFEAFEIPDELEALYKGINEAKQQVACQSFPEAFYPEVGDGISSATVWAKTMCGECPVRNLCAEYGYKYEAHGIWGGLSPRDRKLMRRKAGLRDLESVASESVDQAL